MSCSIMILSWGISGRLHPSSHASWLRVVAKNCQKDQFWPKWIAIFLFVTDSVDRLNRYVNLRPHKFANWAVAQTSIVRMNGIVIRDDIGDASAYHLLADSASADYLWNCLLDAMTEFGGGPSVLPGYWYWGNNARNPSNKITPAKSRLPLNHHESPLPSSEHGALPGRRWSPAGSP